MKFVVKNKTNDRCACICIDRDDKKKRIKKGTVTEHINNCHDCKEYMALNDISFGTLWLALMWDDDTSVSGFSNVSGMTSVDGEITTTEERAAITALLRKMRKDAKKAKRTAKETAIKVMCYDAFKATFEDENKPLWAWMDEKTHISGPLREAHDAYKQINKLDQYYDGWNGGFIDSDDVLPIISPKFYAYLMAMIDPKDTS